MQKIVKFRIKGNSKYFFERYGTSNPIIHIEGIDKEVLKGKWQDFPERSSSKRFAKRLKDENLPKEGKVFYGKINKFPELLHESEIEEIKQSLEWCSICKKEFITHDSYTNLCDKCAENFSKQLSKRQ